MANIDLLFSLANIFIVKTNIKQNTKKGLNKNMKLPINK
jgi:hypothetical protein